MSRPVHHWVAGVGTLVAVNGLVLDRRHDGSTFSECTRMVFRTDTRVGACVFLGFWIGFATWFPEHILRPKIWR